MADPTCHPGQETEDITSPLKIAVEGCAVRNERDLNCMSVPKRYRKMGDFHAYYSGEKKAPVLTLVIGGNHEASNYFSELYHGGWLAPNIYYLGAVGVLRYGPLRIVGISGIYYREDYKKPHDERLPYDRNEIRSIYHVRECDITKLLQIRSPVDIGISHDWPRRVEWFGDHKILFARRPNFFESVKIDKFGSAPAEQVLYQLRPKHWLSGHMHIKFTAQIEHHTDMSNVFKHLETPNEIQAQLPKSMFRAPFESRAKDIQSSPKDTTEVTHFLGLDKPGPYLDFLELLEIAPCSKPQETDANPWMIKTPFDKFALHYDEEWLSILRSSHATLDTTSDELEMALEVHDASETDNPQNLSWVQTNITAKGLLQVPDNFKPHAPVYHPHDQAMSNEQPDEFPNSQTDTFCTMLQIPNRFLAGEHVVEGSEDVVFG